MFGSTQQQPQQQPTSLFGFGSTNPTAAFGNAPQQNQNPPAQTGLFGASASQPPTTGGGLFASTSTQQPSSGLFGSSAATPSGGLLGTTQTAQAGAPAGGLFGATPASGQTTGGLFGNASQPTQSGGLFAGTNAAPNSSMFGATGSGTSGGLFGSTNTNANTNASAPAGGLFASTATAAPSGGLFGNTNASNTGTTGGLFGSTATAPSGSLFGSTQPSTSTTQPSLFASTTQAPNPLFGNTQQQQQQAQPGSLFGNQQQKAGNLFGSSTLGMSALGGNSLTNNLFASKPGSAPGPQQDAQFQFAQLTQRIEANAQAWNSNSPQCRFQHYFYNLVDPAQVHLYGRPPNAFNDGLWQKAVRENPDPTCLVPVVATGFDDVQKRVEAQTQQAAGHQEKIKDLQTRLAALAQRHQLSNASRVQRAAAVQTQLTHRVLRLVQHLHLLIPALRSSALRPEEEALRTALEEIDEEVRRPGGSGRMRGKLNELWAVVGAVSAARERGRGAGGVEWAVVSEEGLAQIAQVLGEQQAGLAHLTRLLHKDMKDLAAIQGSSAQEEDQDLLSSSTATLRL